QGSDVWSRIQESGVSPKNIGFVGNSDGTYDIVFNSQEGTPTGTQEISSSLSRFQQLAGPTPVSQTPPPQASQEKTSFLTEGLYNAVKNLMGEASKQGLAPIFRGGIGGDLMGFAPIPSDEKGILGLRDFFSGLNQPQPAQQASLREKTDQYNKFQIEQLFPNESLKTAVSEETKKKIGVELPNLPISVMFGATLGGLEIFKDILKGQKLPQERIQQIQEQVAQVDEQIGALQSVFTPRQPQGKLRLFPEFAFPFIPYERFGFVPGLKRSGG
ncbi:MAG: hypothetical protein QMD05_06655, partial [Candidatus Brocadiaceae bacterium]|nr:hypothetical protein [Candidatus Brocadiaceae bacterium]